MATNKFVFCLVWFLCVCVFFFRKTALNWSKVTVKRFIMFIKMSILSKCCCLSFMSWELVSQFQKNVSIKQQHSIIVNDVFIAEDWSNNAENVALITGICYILKYIQIQTVILNCNNISQYYCITVFWLNKCSLGEHKRLQIYMYYYYI